MSKKPLNSIREMYGLPRIGNKYDLDGVCQDCVYLGKIRPLFDEKDKEIKRLKNDLLYVLEQLDGYLNKGWTIDLNFTDIKEKYKEDIKEYENWK